MSATASAPHPLTATHDDRRPLYAWIAFLLAVMAIGASDVPRGCDAIEREIAYILSFSECRTAILENDAQVQAIYMGSKH